MNLIENWVHSAAAGALGWTLAHSLWEGALIAVLLAIAFGVLRSAGARYAAACLAMLALLVAFCFTFLHFLTQQTPAAGVTIVFRLPPVPAGDGLSLADLSTRWRASDYLPWLAPFWVAGMVFFHLRGIVCWLSARRLSRTGVCVAAANWQARLDQLANRLSLSRPVTLLESCLAEVPVVIGYLRPVILMPVGLLSGLPAAQVESILLHELAHIKRHDYLVNLLQIVVESLLFYHPAAWWISRRIRAERENCCDDLVVATQGDALAYAAALTVLEQNRGTVRDAALAATGGSLVKRVRRLLMPPEGPGATLTPVFSAAILAVTAAAVLAAWQAPPTAQAPSRRGAAESGSPYEKWVQQDVAYIIVNAERDAFKNLQSDAEREHFIEQFWKRRDPTPATGENEFKEEYYRRIAYANGHFASAIPGWKTDRGRIYITYGPPDEKEVHPSGGSYQRPAEQGGGATNTFPFEQWLYRNIEGVGKNVIIEFVDRDRNGEYTQTWDPKRKEALFQAPGEWPTIATATAKTGATVQLMAAPGTVLISVPLTAFGDHRVIVYTLVAAASQADGQGRTVQALEDPIQGPAQLYTRIISLAKGAYRFEIMVRDTVTSALAADTIAFDVK